jgi:rhodanese-related sulfurtransferase
MRSVLAISLLSLLIGCGRDEAPTETTISGRLEQGLRVLTIDAADRNQTFRIYRGDYVRPVRADGAAFRLTIPGLEVERNFPATADEKPYFTASAAGVYAFTAGDAAGSIEVVEYRAASFRDVTATEAAAFIAENEPLILDVRTRREFDDGRLEGAVLLPIQELQHRIGELSAHKERPVFIYCRTGNRSTVASKLLVDAGHRQVVNLRNGIVDWERRGMTVVR